MCGIRLGRRPSCDRSGCNLMEPLPVSPTAAPVTDPDVVETMEIDGEVQIVLNPDPPLVPLAKKPRFAGLKNWLIKKAGAEPAPALIDPKPALPPNTETAIVIYVAPAPAPSILFIDGGGIVRQSLDEQGEACNHFTRAVS